MHLSLYLHATEVLATDVLYLINFSGLPATVVVSPTPVGNYSPDWAIAFNKDTVKHIFFVAETKGTLETLELRGVEAAKIRCAKQLFNSLSTSKVKYHDVTCYQDLLDKMRAM